MSSNKKKTLHVFNLTVDKLDDVNEFMESKRKELKLDDSVIFRIEVDYWSKKLIVYIERYMTKKEIEDEEAAKIKKMLETKLKKEAEYLKRSEASKKGWVKRLAEKEIRDEKLKKAQQAKLERMLKKRAEKEALLEEEKRKKDFLHNLLYGEDD